MARNIHSAYSPITRPGADFCKIYGHLPKVYGDGVWCHQCDAPWEDIKDALAPHVDRDHFAKVHAEKQEPIAPEPGIV